MRFPFFKRSQKKKTKKPTENAQKSHDQLMKEISDLMASAKKKQVKP